MHGVFCPRCVVGLCLRWALLYLEFVGDEDTNGFGLEGYLQWKCGPCPSSASFIDRGIFPRRVFIFKGFTIDSSPWLGIFAHHFGFSFPLVFVALGIPLVAHALR